MYVCVSTHKYTYIHTHTYTYTCIHTNWRSDSARRKCGTVPQKEFAYLYRRLKCLTVPQEDKVPQVPQLLAERFCTKNVRNCSAEEICSFV